MSSIFLTKHFLTLMPYARNKMIIPLGFGQLLQVFCWLQVYFQRYLKLELFGFSSVFALLWTSVAVAVILCSFFIRIDPPCHVEDNVNGSIFIMIEPQILFFPPPSSLKRVELWGWIFWNVLLAFSTTNCFHSTYLKLERL